MIKGEENEKILLFAKIFLLILEIIIVGIISFIFFGVSKVNAATTTDVMDNYIIYKEGGTSQQGNDGASVTTTGSVEAINFNFGNLEGNVSGQVQITFKYLTNRVGGMYLYVYTGGNLDTNASTSKSCQFTQNGNYYTAKCQFNFNTINETSKYTLLQVQFNPVNNILANIYTASGTAQITPTDLATSNDIQQQTISIIQNALGIATEQSQTIINESNTLGNRIETIINSATNSIQNTLTTLHCETIDKTGATVGKAISGTNEITVENSIFATTDFIKINENTKIKVLETQNSGYQACFYNINKEVISCIALNTMTINQVLTIPQNSEFFKSTIIINVNRPKYAICRNSTDAIIENQNQNTDRMIDHMIGFHEAEEEDWEEEKGLLQSILSAIGGIFSSSIDDPSNTLNSFNNSIASNGTITSLLLLPVTIYQKVINSINATCVDITLGTLWNTTLTMPCLHIDGIIGNALYGTIDVIISGFFILAIRKRFISIFNNLSSLKTGGNELE